MTFLGGFLPGRVSGTREKRFLNKDEILWWSHGGVLHGESPERIKFLKKIMDETPAPGLRPMACSWMR